MLEAIGWIGSIAFAVCGAPQAYKSWMDGHSDGVSESFLYLWIIGEVCSLVYVCQFGHWPLIFNYVGNLVFTGIILKYKLHPRGAL